MKTINLNSGGITLATAFTKDSIQDGGMFDGISCSGAGLAVLFDRHYFAGFVATTNANNVIQENLKLPTYYQDGENINVEVVYGYYDTSGGVIALRGGLTKSITKFEDDDNTEYVPANITLPIANEWKLVKKTFTFSGVGLKSGDTLNFILLRDTRVASEDTLSTTIYIHSTEPKNI